MKVFLTNDDGIHAEGLWALYREFSTEHEVSVIAPDRERSAVGHGITLYHPLRYHLVTVNDGFPGYAVSGTPADCVKMGILEILDSRPDIVISGINPGANVGVNVNYSGTVCAAKEASLYGIPAIAISIQGMAANAYAGAAAFARSLADRVVKQTLPFGTFLNVNLPNLPMEKIAGVKISRQGTQLFPEFVEKRKDPRNKTYFWQGCDALADNGDLDVDETALVHNYITITPIKSDATDYGLIDELKTWKF